MPKKGRVVPKFLSVDKAAGELGCSKRHLYGLISEGHIEAINISASGKSCPQSIRVSVESLERFKAERKVSRDE